MGQWNLWLCKSGYGNGYEMGGIGTISLWIWSATPGRLCSALRDTVPERFTAGLPTSKWLGATCSLCRPDQQGPYTNGCTSVNQGVPRPHNTWVPPLSSSPPHAHGFPSLLSADHGLRYTVLHHPSQTWTRNESLGAGQKPQLLLQVE